MLGVPVTDDEAFKSQLGLQPSIQCLTVLAPVRVVQSVVRAHDGSGTSSHGVGKRPEIDLVNGLVIDITTDGGDRVIGSVDGWVAV
jgi:hypothetical protein